MPQSINHSKRALFKGHFAEQNSFQALPWLKSLDSLSQTCTQCGECLRACPQNIIIKGDGGFPKVDFQLGECDFCYECAASCPESLFTEKQQNPWPNKAEIQSQCLTLHNVFCQSCRDHCPEDIINFKPTLGGISKPEIDSDVCTGCGACIAPCPANAIQIKILRSDK